MRHLNFARAFSLHTRQRAWKHTSTRPFVKHNTYKPRSATFATPAALSHTDERSLSPAWLHPYTEPSSTNLQVTSNWRTLAEQPLTSNAIDDLFANKIPVIRRPSFVSSEECKRVVDVVNTEKVGQYNTDFIFPPVGHIGVSQFDAPTDKELYLSTVDEALSLQRRFIEEAGIDVVERVAVAVSQATGLPVRIAREDGRDYFAGLLRYVENSINIHADYGPYDGEGWEIGRVTGQLTWNILFRQVEAGDTIIYDRQWQGKADDVLFKRPAPSFAYSPVGLQGRIFKAMPALEGDLTLFNPRNFHEVKPCEKRAVDPNPQPRITMSSFIGLLPGSRNEEPTLILWS